MHPVETFELILALLVAMVGLHWVGARLRLPASVALLIGGSALAFLPGLPDVSLDPELVLVLFLPPLLMDGAFFTAFGRFRRHLGGILSLAVGAVLFTTLVVGLVTHALVPGLPWAACFALGAIVSPPDAVSARAVLQRTRLPRRLTALLEGESLLNDAAGLVLFRFAVATTLSGMFDAGAATGNFLLLALGGVAVGSVVASVWIFVMKHLGDETLTIAASALMGWGAYIAGEAAHVSGVIATVTAGLIFGWYQHEIFSAAVRLRGQAFWQTMVFCLEALVFILIGFSLRGVLERVGWETVLTDMAGPVLGIVAAVTAARFVWVFGADIAAGLLRRIGVKGIAPLGWRQATVVGWTGMRGVVTLAVALSLPAEMPARDLMLVAAFAVILVTVVFQGASLAMLIRLVKPQDEEPEAPVQLAPAEAAIFRAKRETVEMLAYSPGGELIHPQLLAQYRKRGEAVERYAADADSFMEGIRSHFDVVLAAIAAGRAELLRLHRQGKIEDEVLHDLERDLDLEELGIIFQRGSEPAPGLQARSDQG